LIDIGFGFSFGLWISKKLTGRFSDIGTD